jgi:hypothetical protein
MGGKNLIGHGMDGASVDYLLKQMICVALLEFDIGEYILSQFGLGLMIG